MTSPFFDDRAPSPEQESSEPAILQSTQGAGRAERAALEHQGLSGARWFYWIAALSLINSIILHSGAQTQFVIGLGTMQVIDGIADGAAGEFPEQATIIRAVAIGLDVCLAGIVTLFGWLCCRRYVAAFIIGMGLYLLDGLIFILVQDWYSVAFHGFALYWMFSGMNAFRKLNALEAEAPWIDDAAAELAPATD